MTRRYNKSIIKETREFAEWFISDYLADYLLGLDELELKMIKSEFNKLINAKIIEIIRNTGKSPS